MVRGLFDGRLDGLVVLHGPFDDSIDVDPQSLTRHLKKTQGKAGNGKKTCGEKQASLEATKLVASFI